MQNREPWELAILEVMQTKLGRTTPVADVLNDLVTYTGSLIAAAAYLGLNRRPFERFVEREGLVYAKVFVPANSELGVIARRRNERQARSVRATRFRLGSIVGLGAKHESLVRQRRDAALDGQAL